jgi:tetratricopeptide (TPR) repeat protein
MRHKPSFNLLAVLTFLVAAGGSTGAQQIESYKFRKQLTNRLETDQFSLVHYLGEEFAFLVDMPPGDALDSLSFMLKGRGDDGEMAYYRAWSYFAHGMIPEAFAEANRYSTLPGKNGYGGKVLLAKLYAVRGSPVMAERLLDAAITMKPDRIDAYLEKAGVYAFRSDVAAGLSEIKGVIKRFPENKRLLLYRGILYTRNREFQSGWTDVKVALESGVLYGDELWLANYWAGAACIGKSVFPQALDYAQQCLVLKPDNPVSLGLRGEAFYRMDSLDRALQDFEKMVETFKDSYYWEIIAAIYEAKGDIPSACSFYQQYCEMFPDQGVSCKKVKKLCK